MLWMKFSLVSVMGPKSMDPFIPCAESPFALHGDCAHGVNDYLFLMGPEVLVTLLFYLDWSVVVPPAVIAAPFNWKFGHTRVRSAVGFLCFGLKSDCFL